ncbi:MAG: hypothetical protein IKF97_07160 [Clostridia bacterium]|nr:hypothetical protein [Clostridia bacterium]
MKSNKGITLVALVITIVVVLILASITINYGTKAIKKSQLENMKTNMLLIKAKAKEYVEQANFKAGVNNEYKDENGNLKEVVASELKGTLENDTFSYITLDDGQYLYNVNSELENMGLKNVNIDNGKNEKYLVRYDVKNATVEIYNTIGYNDNGTTKNSLTQLEQIEY